MTRRFLIDPRRPGLTVVHVADDRLTARMNGHMLDANRLLPLAPQLRQRLDLRRERPLQLDGKVAVQLHPFETVGVAGATKDVSGKRMVRRHLDRQRSL
ncbi:MULTISPECIES: hypothetical protein [unclassified Sphingomonas]|uniref:hypothetical protein n=1 Tax=unclassified Sphingomonas TaxID=196159 RepID=UPI003FA74927